MNVVSEVGPLQEYIAQEKAQGNTIGFVPTMGGIHDGHLSLVDIAHQHCDIVVASIYVNPAQFAAHEDLDQYPRPLEHDQAQLDAHHTHLLFLPSDAVMYPDGPSKGTQIVSPELSGVLCGQSRPHFFGGVCTVVNRLFNIVKPHHAFFGEKDFQQYRILAKMVADLFMDVTLVPCPLVREPDGLAMSSRNRYLSPEERQIAPGVYAMLNEVRHTFLSGTLDTSVLLETGRSILASMPQIELDYLELVDPMTLQPVHTASPGDRLMVAGTLGRTRLIDNIAL